MRKIFLVPLLILGGTAEAPARDEMELQRCVWGCLAKFGPNTNPKYHACVAERCVEGGNSAAKAPRWTSGAAENGGTRYAGVDTPDGDAGLYYFCDKQGRSEIVLAGFREGAAIMKLVVDGQHFPLDFTSHADQLVAAVEPQSDVIGALQTGNTVQILDPTGGVVLELGLGGSSRAIGETVAGCR